MAINRIITETPDPRNVVQSLFGLSVSDLARDIRENRQGKYSALYKRCEKEGGLHDSESPNVTET